MKTSVIHPRRFCILLFGLSAIVSCDSFDSVDKILPDLTKSDYYALPGSSVIIDMTSLGNQSFSSVSLTVSVLPSRGKLTPIGDLLFKYEPGREFQSGQDQFVVTAKSDGKILAKNTIRIHMKTQKDQFPCALIPVEDKIKFDPAMSISIPILENDWLCETDKTSLTISVYSQPLYGQARIEGESIRYTAGPSYQRHDSFIYELKTSSGSVYYGFVSLADRSVESLEAFETPEDHHLYDMVFVDENIGFVVGTDIYKTTDGGKNWFEVALPNGPWFVPSSTDPGYGPFVDINFLNENEGVALYVPCDPNWIGGCGIGLVKTKDGGNSWEDIPINTIDMATSVFFTSSTTGFIGGVLQGYNNYGVTENVILKTQDGGATWRQVLAIENINHGSGLTIKFADAQVGYAYQRGYQPTDDRIFITEDGGESWKVFTTYEHIPAMAVITKDEIFASLSTQDSENDPSSIVRFYGTTTVEEQVANVPYRILHLEFSPSANVGFGIGFSHSNILAIIKSIDKGKTWTEAFFEDFEYWENGYAENFFEAIAVPSDNVVYILYGDRILKYSNK